MYQLVVYFPGSAIARSTISLDRSTDVLDLISKLLAEHEGCEHIVVMFNGIRLFAVDCHGNRVER
jgi:hypothetical protein